MLSEVWPIAIPLRKRDGSIRAHTLVSADDYEAVSQYQWFGYVDGEGRIRVGRNQRTRSRHTTVKLSRELFGLALGDPRKVDHINGDTLDNRRSNLRVTTNAQNMQNRQGATRGNRSSGVRGVTWDKNRGKWRAFARLAGKYHNLGSFDAIVEAEAVVAAFRRAHMPFSEGDKR